MYQQLNITSDTYQLFDYAIIPIVIIDCDFQILYFNKKFSLLTGYSHKEIELKSSFHKYFKIKNFNKLIDEGNESNSPANRKDIEALSIKRNKKVRLLSKSFKFIENDELKVLLQFIDMSSELKLHFDSKTLEYVEKSNQYIEQRLELSNKLLEHQSSFEIMQIGCQGLAKIYPGINIIFLKRILSSNRDGHSIEYIFPELDDSYKKLYIDTSLSTNKFYPNENMEIINLIKSTYKSSRFISQPLTGTKEKELATIILVLNKENKNKRFLGLEEFVSIISSAYEKALLQEENKKIQEKVFQEAKLSSLGRLAAGVAHEINNPLAIVQGNLEILKDFLSQKPDIYKKIENLISKQEESLKRISVIANSMRLFKAEEKKLISLNFNELINETVKIIKKMYALENISFKTNLIAKQSCIEANVNDLQQVLINIFSNAKDSYMTKNTSKKEILIETFNQKNNLLISISDKGCGIKNEFFEKIFDAFFTTKPPGKGTGLGLGIAHKLTSQMKGSLKIVSKENVGTVCTLEFPCLASQKSSIAAEKNKQKSKKTPNLLIVDDEPDVRELLKHHIKDLNFNVYEAENGAVALNMIQKNNYAYILTDLKMPIMNGFELIKRIKELKINSKIIVITGSVFTTQSDKKKKEFVGEIDAFINKPFSKEDIIKKLTD